MGHPTHPPPPTTPSPPPQPLPPVSSHPCDAFAVRKIVLFDPNQAPRRATVTGAPTAFTRAPFFPHQLGYGTFAAILSPLEKTLNVVFDIFTYIFFLRYFPLSSFRFFLSFRCTNRVCRSLCNSRSPLSLKRSPIHPQPPQFSILKALRVTRAYWNITSIFGYFAYFNTRVC